MTRVLHVISGLNVGGAERMLVRLAERLPGLGCPMMVVSLGEEGPLGAEIKAAGVALKALRLGATASLPRGVLQLAGEIRRFDADVVQSWLYHADLAATLATPLAGRRRALAWNLRNTELDLAARNPRTHAVRGLLAHVSRRPDIIISNAAAAIAAHRALGYRPRATAVIPNGFDLSRLKRDPRARQAVRAALGVQAHQVLIGMVARLDPQKDHDAFLEAALRFSATAPEAHFALAGEGLEPDGPFAERPAARALAGRLHLLGRRADIAGVLAAFDIATLTSREGEAFANVLAEAMACETPCVATDVGAAAEIIGADGMVVPRGDVGALAAGWAHLSAAGPELRARMGVAARASIAARFDLDVVSRQYADLYGRLVR
jgi:glycosyltransferase involved in cell wall biosynthesis